MNRERAINILLEHAIRSTDKNDDAYDAGWKNDQGVAEFNSDQFSVTSGWVSIHTIDGGSYGTVTP